MKSKKTQRGFGLIEFDDYNKHKCTIQKSSLATQDCIWLGTDTQDMLIGPPPWIPLSQVIESRPVVGTRAHLTRDQARWLAQRLLFFADNGQLEQDVPDPGQESFVP